MPYQQGQKLKIVTRHQDTNHFAPVDTLGIVEEGTDKNSERMRVRVFRPDPGWRKGGYLHQLVRVSDKIWLERVRNFKRKTPNLPHVHEIVGLLSDEKFEKELAKLQAKWMAEKKAQTP
jgi:hypothetical protein